MYVAGGCVMADCAVGTTNALEIYDPISNTWSSGLAMPTPRFGAASGVINGKLYVTGGTTACAACVPANATEIYNPATNTWAAGAPIPVSRELAAGAVTNGRLYVIGGFQRDPGNSLNGGPVGTVHAYDPAANAWSTASPMPTSRFGAAVGVVFGTIYVAGGYALGPSAVTERYDPGTDAWTPQLSMTTARYYTSGAVAGSTFYVIDGSNGAALDANEAFDSSLTTTITINPTDTTPPTTNATFPQPNTNGWNRFNVNVFLSAFDTGGGAPPSGVQSITYSLSGAQTGGGTFNTGSTSFNIVNEGTTTVTYHATDNRGNVEGDHTFTVKLDKTPPSAANQSNISVNATSAAGAIVTFNLAPSDALSGIDTVSFNQGLPSGSTFPHGTTFENVSITDRAGNSAFRSFNVTVNKTLVSIAVTPTTATVNAGQGQQFQAMGHFTDGSDLVLPSQTGGGSGFWNVAFSPSLDVSGCANVAGGLSSQAISPIAGVVNNYWGLGNIIHVTGTLTAQQVNLTLECNPAIGSTGSLIATWTGTRYEGTVTSFNGSTSAVVITSGGGGSTLPSVSWQSANPSVATIDSSGFATGGSPGQTAIIASAGGITCQPAGCATLTVADTTPPVVTTSGNVTLNATSPAGAVATFTASAFDLVDGVRPVTCAPESGATFPIGVTTVTCTSADLSENIGSATLTVTVLSPSQIITNLIAQVSAVQFKQSGNLLQNAIQNLAAGNVSMACSQLSAFINQVQAQSGKSLSPADAASLIQLAMEAKAAIGC
jgi:hypothetical protein